MNSPGIRDRFSVAGPGRVRHVRGSFTTPLLVAVALPALLAGCKTDLNQQLLERELRMQEDQIYLLQDELEAKHAKLERAVGENVSLKRQLGFVDAVPSPRSTQPSGTAPPARARDAAPTFVPPPRLPSSAPPGAAAPPSSPAGSPTGPRFVPPAGALPPPTPLVPPSLDGVPPLPSAGVQGGVRRLSFEESLAGEGRITHLVVNPARTVCFDGDGDGVAEGLALVLEPRDDDERLVTAAGDLVVFVNDPAVAQGTPFPTPEPTDPGEGGCVARWDIPEAEAIAHFRRTSRARGIHLVLRWPGPPPVSRTVHVHVLLTTFDGAVYRVDAPVSVETGAPASAP